MSITLSYELKQETPMIHFQHGSDGATLRASELKPKLDRFLYRKYQSRISEKWKIDKEKSDSLNYKVGIFASGVPIKSQEIENKLKNNRAKTINAMYFGNMVNDKKPNWENEVREKYKETVLYKDPIKLEINCFIPELRKMIDDSIVEFFMTTNFGTRQSKGFGGFTVMNKNHEKPEEFLKDNGYKFFYAYTGNGSNVNKTMNQAATVYAVMKGGINQRDRDGYIKGYIQRQYFDDIGQSDTGSEKRKIKNELIYRKDSQEGRVDKYSFSRALLGVPEKYEYREKKDSKGNREYFRSTIKVKSREIERFPSIVTIKVINSNLYFIFSNSFERILDKTFQLTEDYKKKTVEIKTPSSFDVDSFIPNFIKYYNSKKDRLKKARYEPFAGNEPLELKNGKDN